MFIPSLKKGDTIAIFNVSDRPAKITQKELDKGVGFLEEMGLKVKVYKKSFDKKTDVIALKDQLHEIFKDKKINGIIFSSGGTKALELLQHLDYKLIKKHPKFIMGYSDCTHILQAVSSKCDFITFHGPVIRNISKWSKNAQKSFINYLVNKQRINYSIGNKVKIFNGGEASGETFVGNDVCSLAVIAKLKLTDFSNKILFIENHSDTTADMVEYWFSWYASLSILNQVSGVVFGNYLVKNKKKVFQKMYDKYLSHLGIPVLAVDFFGEGENCIIPNGAQAHIDLANEEISFSH